MEAELTIERTEDPWKEFVWVVERASWEDNDILGIFWIESEARKCAEADIAREKDLDKKLGPGTRYSWRIKQYEIT